MAWPRYGAVAILREGKIVRTLGKGNPRHTGRKGTHASASPETRCGVLCLNGCACQMPKRPGQATCWRHAAKRSPPGDPAA